MTNNPKIASAADTNELLNTYKTLDDSLASGLVLNRVMDLTGRVEVDGTSIGLSSKADQKLMGTIRGTCDAVLIGGNTLRSEIYRPNSNSLAKSKLVVVTRGQNIDLVANYDNVIVLSESTEPNNFSGTWIARNTWTPDNVLSQLTELGLDRVVCEAGPGLSSQFFNANSFSELYLTISPRLGNGTKAETLVGNNNFELVYSISGPESFIFTKWQKSKRQTQ